MGELRQPKENKASFLGTECSLFTGEEVKKVKKEKREREREDWIQESYEKQSEPCHIKPFF